MFEFRISYFFIFIREFCKDKVPKIFLKLLFKNHKHSHYMHLKSLNLMVNFTHLPKNIINLFVVLSFYTSYAQKFIEPTAEEISQAQELRKKYDKSDVAIISAKEHFKFNLNKELTLVEVDQSINETLLNINYTSKIQKYEFYDGQSSILDFSIRNKLNKTVDVQVMDEYYISDDLFYNDARVTYTTLNFPLQGSTYLYEMKKKYKDVKYFTSIYFNDENPILHKEVLIEIPKWLSFEIKEFNFGSHAITKSITETNESVIYKYSIENMEGSKSEMACPGPSYVYPHVLFVAKSYTKQGKNITLYNSTQDLYNWYKSLVNEMKDKPDVFRNKVLELTSQAKTDEEKIKNIYYWVQDNIRYIAFEDGIAGFKPDESQNVFEKKYGDCKGMANLTKQMLVVAGFDARLSWIGTRHIAYDYSIPSLSVDNHMICTVFLNGKKYYLDSTIKYGSLDENSENIQGKEIMIENGDNFIIEKIEKIESQRNLESKNISLALVGEDLIGKIKLEFNNESKTHFLNSYNSIKNNNKDEALKYYLTSDNKNIKVNNIVTSDLNNRDQLTTINYDFEIKNQASQFDDEMYIDLNIDKTYDSFDFSERKMDYLFPYKTYDIIHTTFEIPQGYKVKELPENLIVKNDDYEFSLIYENKNNTITYTKTFNFKNAKVQSKDFESWKNHQKQLAEHYSDQIVLTK